MTLEEARDLMAERLIVQALHHGVPNRFYCADLFPDCPMVAGRIGSRFLRSLNNVVAKLAPAEKYRVSYDRFKPNQPKSFHVYRRTA